MASPAGGGSSPAPQPPAPGGDPGTGTGSGGAPGGPPGGGSGGGGGGGGGTGGGPPSGPPVGQPGPPVERPPGGGIITTPSLIKQLAQKIDSIKSTLEKASSSLEGADISGDAFSGKGIALANVYPGALDFGKNDVKTKITQLQSMSDGLIATAATWEQAEQASTVKTQ